MNTFALDHFWVFVFCSTWHHDSLSLYRKSEDLEDFAAIYVRRWIMRYDSFFSSLFNNFLSLTKQLKKTEQQLPVWSIFCVQFITKYFHVMSMKNMTRNDAETLKNPLFHASRGRYECLASFDPEKHRKLDRVESRRVIEENFFFVFSRLPGLHGSTVRCVVDGLSPSWLLEALYIFYWRYSNNSICDLWSHETFISPKEAGKLNCHVGRKAATRQGCCSPFFRFHRVADLFFFFLSQLLSRTHSQRDFNESPSSSNSNLIFSDA